MSKERETKLQLYLAALTDNETEYIHILLLPALESTLRPLKDFVNHGHSSLRPRTKKHPTAVFLEILPLPILRLPIRELISCDAWAGTPELCYTPQRGSVFPCGLEGGDRRG